MTDVLRLRDGATVTAAVHRPATVVGPAVLLTHGAGGDLGDQGLVALATGLSSAGHLVVRANLPYRERGRRARPPAAERSVPGFRELVAVA
ncbi:MAG: alpha/beta hydrolase, partial [Nitriliruptorales bacterium]